MSAARMPGPAPVYYAPRFTPAALPPMSGRLGTTALMNMAFSLDHFLFKEDGEDVSIADFEEDVDTCGVWISTLK
jgi:hypothetical protein